MKVLWTNDGWDDYLYWQATDHDVVPRINELIKDARRDPFKGTGKPEPLPIGWRCRMRRREFITLLGSAAAAWPGIVRAQQGNQHVIPFLIDLQDWTGSQPAGAEEERNGRRVITGSRNYSRGAARFDALIMSDTGAASNDARIIIEGMHKSTSTIDGFQVTTESTPISIWIGIKLGPHAIFGLFFTNVSEVEAVAIARKFDWKGMRALVN